MDICMLIMLLDHIFHSCTNSLSLLIIKCWSKLFLKQCTVLIMVQVLLTVSGVILQIIYLFFFSVIIF